MAGLVTWPGPDISAKQTKMRNYAADLALSSLPPPKYGGRTQVPPQCFPPKLSWRWPCLPLPGQTPRPPYFLYSRGNSHPPQPSPNSHYTICINPTTQPFLHSNIETTSFQCAALVIYFCPNYIWSSLRWLYVELNCVIIAGLMTDIMAL